MTAAEALSRHHHHPEPDTLHDPVCGMTVNPAKARHRAEHSGQSYLFCGAKCREKFTADPARYIVTPPSASHDRARRGPMDLPHASADCA